MNQRGLADRIGVRLWMVDQWETGARAVPKEQLVRVAEVTGRPAQWFLTGADERLTEHTAESSVIGAASAALQAAELERLARGVAERELALAESEAEMEALAKKIEETRLQADERLAELEGQERELRERRRELEERESLLEEAAQEAETKVAAARIEAKAIVARAEHACALVNRDRAEVSEVLKQLRAALEEAFAKWNSLAHFAVDGDGHESAQNHGNVDPAAQTDELADDREADLDGDVHVRLGGGHSDGEETVTYDA